MNIRPIIIHKKLRKEALAKVIDIFNNQNINSISIILSMMYSCNKDETTLMQNNDNKHDYVENSQFSNLFNFRD